MAALQVFCLCSGGKAPVYAGCGQFSAGGVLGQRHRLFRAEHLDFCFAQPDGAAKYDGRHGLRQLLWFALWANLAIYTKETNIFVYFGILLYLVLAKVWAGKITLRSFLSPFKTVAGMPAEYILFWSMLLFPQVICC